MSPLLALAQEQLQLQLWQPLTSLTDKTPAAMPQDAHSFAVSSLHHTSFDAPMQEIQASSRAYVKQLALRTNALLERGAAVKAQAQQKVMTRLQDEIDDSFHKLFEKIKDPKTKQSWTIPLKTLYQEYSGGVRLSAKEQALGKGTNGRGNKNANAFLSTCLTPKCRTEHLQKILHADNILLEKSDELQHSLTDIVKKVETLEARSQSRSWKLLLEEGGMGGAQAAQAFALSRNHKPPKFPGEEAALKALKAANGGEEKAVSGGDEKGEEEAGGGEENSQKSAKEDQAAKQPGVEQRLSPEKVRQISNTALVRKRFSEMFADENENDDNDQPGGDEDKGDESSGAGSGASNAAAAEKIKTSSGCECASSCSKDQGTNFYWCRVRQGFGTMNKERAGSGKEGEGSGNTTTNQSDAEVSEEPAVCGVSQNSDPVDVLGWDHNLYSGKMGQLHNQTDGAKISGEKWDYCVPPHLQRPISEKLPYREAWGSTAGCRCMSQNEINGSDPKAGSLADIYGTTEAREVSDEGLVPLKDRFSHFMLEKYKVPNDGNVWKNPMHLPNNAQADPMKPGQSRGQPEFVYHPHSKICRKVGESVGGGDSSGGGGSGSSINSGGYAVCPLASRSPDCQTDRSWDFCNLEGWTD